MQQSTTARPSARTPDSSARAAAVGLSLVPLSPRRLQLAGIDTAVLEGGDGPPMILLHGPAGHAAHWFRVVPALLKKYRLIVPDLPGHGDSIVREGTLDSEQIVAWLNELITMTCPTPPTILGETLGAAIALRYAGQYGNRVSRLILVDSMGLAPFEPQPAFGAALHGFLSDPNHETHDALWKQCVYDLDALKQELGEGWTALKRYNLELAATPSVMTALVRLMEEIGTREIPDTHLARITTPVVLVWGRLARAIPLAVGESASLRYGWPLHVVEDSGIDVMLEKPEELARIALE